MDAEKSREIRQKLESVRIRHYGRSLAPEFILSRERTLAAGLQLRPADVRANRWTERKSPELFRFKRYSLTLSLSTG